MREQYALVTRYRANDMSDESTLCWGPFISRTAAHVIQAQFFNQHRHAPGVLRCQVVRVLDPSATAMAEDPAQWYS